MKYFELDSTCPSDQEDLQHLEEEPTIIFVPCPPPFDVSYVGTRRIIDSVDHLVDESIIFLSYISFDGDSSDLINQPSSNIYIPPVNLPPIDQDEPLDGDVPNYFLLFELYGHGCWSNMDESLFLHEDLDLQDFQKESDIIIEDFLSSIAHFDQ